MPVKLFECGFGDVQGTRVWQCFGAVNLISAVRCAGGSGGPGVSDREWSRFGS